SLDRAKVLRDRWCFGDPASYILVTDHILVDVAISYACCDYPKRFRTVSPWKSTANVYNGDNGAYNNHSYTSENSRSYP
ncbi:MAG: hypothetical protein KIT18_16395, partial [Burkholderiales bacterium]|nr:hypothetical protein [Burkholderiales bacterium]